MYYLRPVERKDFDYLIELRNYFIDNLRQPYFLNEVSQDNWFTTTNDQYFIILDDTSLIHEKVGCVGLTQLDLVNRKSEISLITNGYLHKEIANFALNELERYFFNKLSGHKLFVTVFEFDKFKMNYFSDRYKGYQFVIPDNVFYKGKYWDEYYFCILEDEWRIK